MQEDIQAGKNKEHPKQQRSSFFMNGHERATLIPGHPFRSEISPHKAGGGTR
jgi:hypothetical protein